MASKTEIKKEVHLALKEIGTITPWYDRNFDTWLYSNPLYPIECEGTSEEEVVEKYPKYIEVFIEHRMKGTLDHVNEKKTKGKGGARSGAGRPKGSVKEQTKQVRVPLDIAEILRAPGVIEGLRNIHAAKTG
jgi:hypothetical protein